MATQPQRLHTEREYKGTGIGLAIVKDLVTHMGGRISVLPSEPGRGAVFQIELPGAERVTDSAPTVDAALASTLATRGSS